MKKRSGKSVPTSKSKVRATDRSKLSRNVGHPRRVTAKVYRRSPVYESVARLEERVEHIIDKLNRHCGRHWVIESGMFLAAIGVLGELIFKHVIK